jgi:hypothetical protein
MQTDQYLQNVIISRPPFRKLYEYVKPHLKLEFLPHMSLALRRDTNLTWPIRKKVNIYPAFY